MRPLGTGRSSQFLQPLMNRGSDSDGIILLETVKTGTDMDQPAILYPVSKALAECGRHHRSGIPGEKYLRIKGLRQGAVRLFEDCEHCGPFFFDRQVTWRT